MLKVIFPFCCIVAIFAVMCVQPHLPYYTDLVLAVGLSGWSFNFGVAVWERLRGD